MRSQKGVLGGMFMIIASFVILSGCATVTEQLIPVPNPPSLIGKWTGEWGGTMVHPIELVINKQDGGNVTGKIIDLERRHAPATYQVSGTIGTKQYGSVWVVLAADGRDFPLKVVSERRLEGTGRSRWHYGPVTLTRE